MSEFDHERTSGDEAGLTIDELAERFGVSVRAVRYYIAQGLLPGPSSRGKLASYGEEHLTRLGLIRQLSERHVPLAKIQALLEGLSTDDLKALRVAEADRSLQLEEAERGRSPQDYVAALLDTAREARHTPLPQAPRSPDISPEPVARAGSAHVSLQRGSAGENWYRWTLAPGIELHVSAEARIRFQGLLRRILLAAQNTMKDD